MKTELAALGAKLMSGALGFYLFDVYKQTPCFFLVYSLSYLLLSLFLSECESSPFSIHSVKASGYVLACCYGATVIFGGAVLRCVLFSLETVYISVLLWLAWTAPWLGRRLPAAGIAATTGAVVAVTQYPLDWDYEVAWQEYPFPVLYLTEMFHLAGLAVASLWNSD